MFLIERLVSLFAFAGVLVFFMLGISLSKGKQYKVFLWMYWIVLGIFAYVYVPHTTADLYRLHLWCVYGWCQVDWMSLWELLRQSREPMWLLFSWTIYQITHNENWIQTVACLWSFYNVFYIISHTIDKVNIKKYNRALLLFSIMAVGTFYLEVISGIRSMLSFSIVCFCIYQELIERKSVVRHLPLYIFAALLHKAGLALIMIRFVFEGLLHKNIMLKLLGGLIGLGCILLINIGADQYVEYAIDTAIRYSTNENEYTYHWEILIGLIEQIQIFYILYQYKKQYQKSNFLYTKMGRLVLILVAICLIALPFSYAIFRRYTVVCSILVLPLLGQLLSTNNPRYSKTVTWIICLFSILIFGLSCIRGDLCGYKFFLLGGV